MFVVNAGFDQCMLLHWSLVVACDIIVLCLLWRWLVRGNGIEHMPKVVWITGAASGIGRACTEVFLFRGDTVVACDRSREGQCNASCANARPCISVC